MKKKILLIVDPLNDFADKNGALYVPEGEKVIPEINKLMNDINFDIIVLIQDWHPSNHKSFASNNSNAELFSIKEVNGIQQVMWTDHCIQNTWGAEPHPDLDKKWTHVIRKGMNPEVDSYSAFFENDKKTKTDIHELFSKLKVRYDDELHIVGLATDYCVKYTTIDSLNYHQDVTLHTKCIRGINPDDVEKTLNELKENVDIV